MKQIALVFVITLVVIFAAFAAFGCGVDRTASPDAPLPTCAELGCPLVAICASHDGPCTCNGTTCTMGAK